MFLLNYITLYRALAVLLDVALTIPVTHVQVKVLKLMVNRIVVDISYN